LPQAEYTARRDEQSAALSVGPHSEHVDKTLQRPVRQDGMHENGFPEHVKGEIVDKRLHGQILELNEVMEFVSSCLFFIKKKASVT